MLILSQNCNETLAHSKSYRIVMEKEITLVLAIINAWWYKYSPPSMPFRGSRITDFEEMLKRILVDCEVRDLDIIYHPVQDRWVIRGEDER